jgi:peptide/nickel transport system substrate-binding protein
MLKRLRFYIALLAAFVRRDKRKITFSFIGLLLLIFVLRVVLPSAVPQIHKIYVEFRKPTFVEGAVGEPEHPNPLFDSNETQRDISSLVFRGLTKVNKQGVLVPDLAENYKRISETEYVFNLKKDVYWHDNRRFTSDDVVYTIESAENPKYESEVADNFKDITIEKLDSYTVKFILEEPFAPFPFATTTGIIPKHVPLKKYRPVGTGDFRVKSINKDKITLSSEKMNLVFKFYVNFDEAKTALKLGEIHALGGFAPQETETLKYFGGKKFFSEALPFRQVAVFFNTRGGSLKNKKIRQALSYALDKNDLKLMTGGSESIKAKNQLSIGSWVDTDGKERYSYSLKNAGELLRESGYKFKDNEWHLKDKKLSFTIVTTDDLELNSVANLLKESWRKLGVDVGTKIIDVEILRSDIIPNRKFDVLVDFREISPDPDQYVLWHTTQTRKTNISGIRSAKLDKLLEDARKETNKERRKPKYRLFTKLLLDEAPAIFLYYPQYIWAVSEKVGGIKLVDFATPADRFNSYKNWKIKKNSIF